MRRRNNKLLLLVLLIPLLMSIGYSVLGAKLGLNGSLSVNSGLLINVNWNNLEVNSSSMNAVSPVTIASDKTELEYSLNFTTPGQFYEFSFDSVDNDDSDTMIQSITSTINDTDITNLPSFLEYSATYEDGTRINSRDYLKMGNENKERIIIRVKLKDNATSEQISTLTNPTKFNFIINYLIADATAKEVVHVNNCTYDGELIQGAEYINGQYKYRYKQEVLDPSEPEDNWENMVTNEDGWGVGLVNYESTDPINTKLCSSINGKPIVSMKNTYLFSQAPSIDLSTSKTSNVIDMSGMFEESLATSINLSTLDTSNVTDMSSMFYSSAATSLELSNFDTSNVTDMNDMFSNSATGYINLSSFNTSKVKYMSGMFEGLKNQDLNLNKFDTSNVEDMSSMFLNAKITPYLALTNFNTSKVKDMNYMFGNTSAISLLQNFDTSNVEDMHGMFSNSSFSSLDLSNFNTTKVTNMSSMFSESNVTTLVITSFDTSNVTIMTSMFQKSKATTLDISSFNTSKVTNMATMFEQCSNLTTIYIGSGWNTSNVTTSTNMFYNSTKLPNYSRYYVDKTRAHANTRGYMKTK